MPSWCVGVDDGVVGGWKEVWVGWNWEIERVTGGGRVLIALCAGPVQIWWFGDLAWRGNPLSQRQSTPLHVMHV